MTTMKHVINDRFSEEDINDAIEAHLKEKGVEDPPDLNWASCFIGTIRKLGQKYKWTEETRNRALTSTLSDVLLGWNLRTGNPLEGAGPLHKWIKREMERDDRDEEDMQNLLASMVAQKALQRQHEGTEFGKNRSDQVFRSSSDGEEEETRPDHLLSEIFEIEDDHKGKANRFLGRWNYESTLSDGLNRRMKELTRKIKQKAKKGRDTDVRCWVVWKTYLQHAGDILSGASKRDMVDMEVHYEANGNIYREKLRDALFRFKDTDKVTSKDIYYEVKCLKEQVEELDSKIINYLKQ